MVSLRSFVTQPVQDYVTGLDRCLRLRISWSVPLMAFGFLCGWMVYVPLHELLHAFGCMATGGDVTRLEIDAIYGAALLQRIFPWVAVGSEYAGRLTGFDTHGNDLIYLATDAAPFLLTVFAGIPLLRWIPRAPLRDSWRCFWFGAALPVAFAPFVSLPGDYYEMGSIVVSRLAALAVGDFDVARWRSDDLLKLIDQLFSDGKAASIDYLGVGAAFVVGLLAALATYAAGVAVQRWVSARTDRTQAP
jgi:hypothetical protein